MKNSLTMLDIIKMSKMVNDEIAENPDMLPIIEKMAHVKLLSFEEWVDKHIKKADI